MWFVTVLFLNLLRRKARSVLTVCGVGVAIGTTVALLGIARGFEESSVQAFEGRGVQIVVIEQGVLDQLSSDLDASLTRRIERVPGVHEVARGLVELVDYSQSGSLVSLVLHGWEANSFLFDDLKILRGRLYRSDERNVAILGSTLAENIGKDVGDRIAIQREEFEVVGVYQSFNIFENGAATIPLAELQRVMARPDGVTGFSIRLHQGGSPPVSVDAVCERINALVDESGQPLGMVALPTKDYANSAMHLRIAHAMAWTTSAVAIVVGAIGMLNTMLMSVVERVREICILRAIGWRKSRIARMILGECMLLSLCGATVGTLAALVLTYWLTMLPVTRGFIEGRISPTVIAQGFAIALAVALCGGAYPAYRAVQLPPAMGLSHE